MASCAGTVPIRLLGTLVLIFCADELSAAKLKRDEVHAAILIGNLLVERPHELSVAQKSMFVDGVCAAPGGGARSSAGGGASGSGTAATGSGAGGSGGGTSGGGTSSDAASSGLSGAADASADGVDPYHCGPEGSGGPICTSPCWVQAHDAKLGVQKEAARLLVEHCKNAAATVGVGMTTPLVGTLAVLGVATILHFVAPIVYHYLPGYAETRTEKLERCR